MGYQKVAKVWENLQQYNTETVTNENDTETSR